MAISAADGVFDEISCFGGGALDSIQPFDSFSCVSKDGSYVWYTW